MGESDLTEATIGANDLHMLQSSGRYSKNSEWFDIPVLTQTVLETGRQTTDCSEHLCVCLLYSST